MDALETLTVGEADPDLDTQLNNELTAFNVGATGVDDQRELTVRVTGGDGRLVAGLSGWTWGTCCGISLVWVREDAAYVREANGEMGCARILADTTLYFAEARSVWNRLLGNIVDQMLEA